MESHMNGSNNHLDSDVAVEAVHLTKRFGNLLAVDDINLTIYHGEIFGLLGPNGAGKTTLTRMLTTVLQPSDGEAHVAGYDIRKDSALIRESIGVVSQAMTLDIELTAWENMDLYAKYYKIPYRVRQDRIGELLKIVGLEKRANTPVGNFSGGMKRRLELVRSLVHQPKILFLDEPTTGLDPQARIAVWEYLKKIHEEGICIIITTHYLDEAESLCDRVAIIDFGKLVALGSPRELKRKIMGGDIIEIEFEDLPSITLEALKNSKLVLGIKQLDNILTITVKSGAESVPQIVELINKKGGKIRSITIRATTLDDVFLHFTGRSLRDSADIRNKKFMSVWEGMRR